MILVYLTVLILALYWVIKAIGPEMLVVSKPPNVAQPKPKIAMQSKPQRSVQPKPSDITESSYNDNRQVRLETLLSEKNKDIALLQRELSVFQAQVRSFDKLRLLLEEEIHHLREQNRIFRSELGMPPIATFGDNALTSGKLENRT